MIIRPESPVDHQAVFDITAAAFENHAFSRQTEPYIIEALRVAGALTLSLVAERDGQVVGHIAFSPVTISDGTEGWYGVGPLSVVPSLQKQGIGKSLMEAGLARMKALGSSGCMLVGDPGYYRRFGFKNFEELIHPGIPPQYFMALSFTGKIPRGSVEFHSAFHAKKPSA